MASFHQTIIAGNLGRDPETRYLPSGEPVCNFSVAVTEKWKKEGVDQERTTWYRVVAFKKLAEICGQYLRKGSGVLIVGKMRTRKYEKDGVERETWELEADTMQMIGGRGDGQGTAPSSPAPSSSATRQPRPQNTAKPSFDDLDDDVPF